jgi:hypothetical protein
LAQLASGKLGSPAKAEITHHKGKGSQQQMLPSRTALSTLAGAPNKSINDYSKAGASITQNGASLTDPEKQ